MKAFGRLRRNASDLLQLFIVPLCIALLPWRLGFALVRRLAKDEIAFQTETDAAWRGAKPWCGAIDERRWRHNYRLMRWIERVDTYWLLTRSTRWWLSRIDVVGALPAPTSPGLLLTYHWGAGSWIWKLLRAHGIASWFVARRPLVSDFGAGRIALWYGRLRSWSMTRIGGLGVLYTGGSSALIGAALARGQGVCGMLDLPASDAARTRSVNLLGVHARLPSGLLQLDASRGAPVTLFSCALDFSSGRRTLRVESVPPGLDPGQLLQRYAAHLDARLRDAPEAWHMWHEVGAIVAVEGAPPITP